MNTPEDTDEQPNVFQMFVANGGAGFWVRRTTWHSTCARVVRVGALTGPDPYYGNPSVLMDVYGLDGTLRDGAAQLPVPGTYKTWRWIEAPEWAKANKLRPLDDPALDETLLKLDRRRGKSRATSTRPRADLAVPYDRRGEAKGLGARWDSVARTWWIPTDDAEAVAKALQLGFLEHDPRR
jgi:hypothetical protein